MSQRSKPPYWIILLLIIALSGYGLAYIQYSNNIELQQELLNSKVGQIEMINDSLLVVRSETEITIEELKRSRMILDALILEAEQRDTTNLTLEEALKIIEGL